MYRFKAAPPNLNLGPEEKRVYGQLFRLADTEGVGVVTGDVAVKFFEKTKLDSSVLGEVGGSLLVVDPQLPANDAIRRYGKSQTMKTEGSLLQQVSALFCVS